MWILTSFTVNEGGSLPMPLGCHKDIICSLKPARCATTAKDVSILRGSGATRNGRGPVVICKVSWLHPTNGSLYLPIFWPCLACGVWRCSAALMIWPSLQEPQKWIRGDASKKKECLKCLQSGFWMHLQYAHRVRVVASWYTLYMLYHIHIVSLYAYSQLFDGATNLSSTAMSHKETESCNCFHKMHGPIGFWHVLRFLSAKVNLNLGIWVSTQE